MSPVIGGKAGRRHQFFCSRLARHVVSSVGKDVI